MNKQNLSVNKSSQPELILHSVVMCILVVTVTVLMVCPNIQVFTSHLAHGNPTCYVTAWCVTSVYQRPYLLIFPEQNSGIWKSQ